MDSKFIQKRLFELVNREQISQSQMSLDLGHSRGYIRGITSGRSLPTMEVFLEICDYLNITPAEFFETSDRKTVIDKTVSDFLQLEPESQLAMREIIKKLK